MADNEKFCLRLNSFESNVKMYWQELQMDKDMCDVTLACGDKQFQAHKMVISSFSPVLKNIIKMNQNPNVVIYLRRVKYKNLENLITFMYQGEVDVAEQDLPSFLEVAEDLNIRGLSEANQDSYSSEEEILPQFLNQDIEPSFERKRNKNSIENVAARVAKFVEPDENYFIEPNGNLFNNDTDKNKSLVPIKRRPRSEKQNYENNRQSLVLDNGKQFVCVSCGKKFSSKGGLCLHKQSSHMGVQFSCDKCDYKAAQKSTLKQHVASMHEGKRHPCQECDYKAPARGSLRVHILKYHNGKK